MIADADKGYYADDGEGRHGGHREDNGGVPITYNR